MPAEKQLGILQDIIEAEPLKTRWQGVVTKRYLTALKRRHEFQKLFAELQKDNLTRARALIKAKAPEYIEADYEGMTMARDAGDYKALTSYTKPIIDRVWPKAVEEQHVTAIKIELTPRQLKEIDEDEIVVEAEIIEAPNDDV
jgi:hypothetical protein